MQNSTQEPCCPRFDPQPWDRKMINWENKLFVKKTLPTIFHMPIPGMITKTINEAYKKAQAAGAAPSAKDFMWITYDPSAWKSESYLHVTKEVPGLENVNISGTFLTKVFDGPFRDVPKWIKEMETYVASQGKKAQKYYFYYTTCPKCAKIYGHNYVVILAQV